MFDGGLQMRKLAVTGIWCRTGPRPLRSLGPCALNGCCTPHCRRSRRSGGKAGADQSERLLTRKRYSPFRPLPARWPVHWQWPLTDHEATGAGSLTSVCIIGPSGPSGQRWSTGRAPQNSPSTATAARQESVFW